MAFKLEYLILIIVVVFVIWVIFNWGNNESFNATGSNPNTAKCNWIPELPEQTGQVEQMYEQNNSEMENNNINSQYPSNCNCYKAQNGNLLTNLIEGDYSISNNLAFDNSESQCEQIGVPSQELINQQNGILENKNNIQESVNKIQDNISKMLATDRSNYLSKVGGYQSEFPSQAQAELQNQNLGEIPGYIEQQYNQIGNLMENNGGYLNSTFGEYVYGMQENANSINPQMQQNIQRIGENISQMAPQIQQNVQNIGQELSSMGQILGGNNQTNWLSIISIIILIVIVIIMFFRK